MSYCMIQKHTLFVDENHVCEGSNFNAVSIKEIIINIHHCPVEYCDYQRDNLFTINIILLKYVLGEGLHEIRFSYDLTSFYDSIEIPKEKFVRFFTKNVNKFKIPEKKALISNEKFVEYVYECLTKTMNRYSQHQPYYFGL